MMINPTDNLTRKLDWDSSTAAAARVQPRLTRLQAAILAHFRRHHARTNDGLTAAEVERHPDFADYGYSTVRKRVTELHQAGLLFDSRRRRRGSIVWTPATGTPARPNTTPTTAGVRHRGGCQANAGWWDHLFGGRFCEVCYPPVEQFLVKRRGGER